MKPDELDQLLAIIGIGEFEDNGRMRVVSVHWSSDRLTVRLQVDHGTGENSSWQLRFTGVFEYLFADVYHCGLNIWRGAHPAIDQYLQPREFLHFASAPADPHRVVGKLWAAHVAIAEDWIPFDRYLNRALPLLDLLAGGVGLLATAPRFLISAYVDVLEKENCRPTRQALPKRHSVTSVLLAHFGGSTVVAQQVVAKRLVTPNAA
jgi:hypothetical protein